MARRLFTVEDTFMIEGRGLVAVPGIVPQGDERFRAGDTLLFKRPDGSEVLWAIGGLELSCPLPSNKGVCVLLVGLREEDVPIGTEVWSVNKYGCPCCGYKTLDEKPPGTYDICPVCFWEDESVDLEWRGGANGVSLRQGQANFLELGACEARFTGNVRAPQPGEERDPNWRPIDPPLEQ